jgi:diguanylate cyclase (GGDEF)-like protein/PAS domain S-box-containing protein
MAWPSTPFTARDAPGGSPRASQALAEAGAKDLIERVPAIVYVAEVGVEGQWHYVSAQAEAILGFAPGDWLSNPRLWAELIHPQDRERVFERERKLEEPQAPEEYRMRHRDGRTVWVRDHAALVADELGRLCWHGVLSDITDRKLIEDELECRAAQQAAVAFLGRRALEGVDLGELMAEAVLQATRILDVELGAVLEFALDDVSVLLRAGSLPAGLGSSVSSVIEERNRPWGLFCVQSSGPREYSTADKDFVQALANVLADAIQRKSSEDDISHRALHDPLTGLPNRAHLLDRLESARSSVAVLLLDIDHFKLVNDSLGHATGDALLVEIAPRLGELLRPQDLIGRLGGDEFVVLLEGISGEGAAVEVAERILGAFAQPFLLDGVEHFATVSVGIAVSTGTRKAPESMIRDADAALYRAKDGGRARHELFDQAMRSSVLERVSIENDLRRALEREQFYVDYQPIIWLPDGSISGVEALLRWRHPARGLVGPAEFIPVAEESGQICQIGAWVLGEACRQAGEWHAAHPDDPPLRVAVNLSGRQLAQRDLPGMVARTLRDTGIAPRCLRLEITESVILDESEATSRTLHALLSLGVSLVLDDFGTGYSSLGYLTRLPIDGLKIDRSFIQGLGCDERSTAVVTAIIRMAQALSLEVTGEGVESVLQVEELRRLGCECAQGFYFARPLPALEIAELL